MECRCWIGKSKKDFGRIAEILLTINGDPTGNRTPVSGVRGIDITP